VFASVLALALASAAFALTKSPPGSPPAGTSAAEAKFKAADKNSNGSREAAETDAYRADLTRIDTNKDGKITRDEFLTASKSGIVK
jgi:hypothetical protein